MQQQNNTVLVNNQNNTIDVSQMPVRLMSQQKNSTRAKPVHQRNNTVVQGQNGAAWQSIDVNADVNKGLIIQPCSNQAQNLISGPATKVEHTRPSVTQGNNSPGTARSPRGVNIKGQFYAVHGRGMSINNGENTKGILTKIFKNQQHRQQAFQQNYIEHLNATHGSINSNRANNTQLKSPIANLREHLHTQGRTRSNQPQLETGPLGHNRGNSLNIQELYSHYQKSGNTGRNVTYYNSSKNPQ